MDQLNSGSTQKEWDTSNLFGSSNLNKAFLREHYALPTIEDIATRLHGAKLFTILDVRCGFWHVELDESSSYLHSTQPFN